MRILILSPKMPWPPKDGGAIATLNLAVGLALNGADVTLLAMNTGKHFFPPDQVPGYLKDLIRIRAVSVDTRIRPLRLVMNLLFSSYPYIAERFISGEFQKELGNCQEEKGFDIVQFEGPYMGYYVRFIREGPLLALRAHNLEHRIWEFRANKDPNPFRRLYLKSLARRIRKLEQNLLGKMDMLVPISESDAEGFREIHHGLPILVCPTGIDLAKYEDYLDTGPDKIQAGVLKSTLSLFYIGALDWVPNQEGLNWFFEHVWPGMLSRWPGLELHIAGRNASVYFTSSLPPNVHNEGEVEDALLFYQGHDVMIVPLLSGSGIRIKILEAMAMGKVVISTPLGASGIGASDGRHLFIAESAETFLGILEKLHGNPELIIQIGQQARQFVKENFDNLVLSEKLIVFYKAGLT
jgi:glycosyltransferase involved in cell wall biosynthesis